MKKSITEKIERLVEESIWEKTKDFAAGNPAITMGLTGAALGGIYNAATGGAEDLGADRKEDYQTFQHNINRDIAKNDVANEDTYNDVYDAKSPGFFKRLFASKESLGADQNSAAANHKEIYNSIDPNKNTEDNYNKYIDTKADAVSPDRFKQTVDANQELQKGIQAHQNDIQHATRDSYLHSVAGGAALGTGGMFAKRYLDKKKQDQQERY